MKIVWKRVNFSISTSITHFLLMFSSFSSIYYVIPHSSFVHLIMRGVFSHGSLAVHRLAIDVSS